MAFEENKLNLVMRVAINVVHSCLSRGCGDGFIMK